MRILTVAEFVADLEEMAKKICDEEGIVYEDFIADVAYALQVNQE